MTESTLRFLRAITERVPLSRIAALHLFPTLKQGGVETGVAVLAAVPEAVGEEPVAPRHADRHIVYTARYRLTLRGADRGKWEMDLVAEADAPLVTIEEVVRGVQERAGDATVPERFTGDTLRDRLAEPAWTTTP